MADLGEIERRIAAIESRLGLESGLRASQDRDLADLAQSMRAQQHTIQALAITQSQHNEKLDRQGERLDRQGEQLDRQGELLDRHEESLTAAHGKLDQIITLLDRLLDDTGR